MTHLHTHTARWLMLAGLSIASAVAAVPSVAANTAKPEQVATASTVKVEGFRSARFGMVEKDLRAAIKKDFDLDAGAITLHADPTERTNSLIISVDNLLPDSGPAAIVYIMGYKSKALFRVNIAWGHGISDALSAEQVTGLANSLRNYLVGQGYNPEGLVLNQPIDDGSVVAFQGRDAQGRMTPVVEADPEGKAQPKVQGASLRLSYTADPENPDIFKVEAGF